MQMFWMEAMSLVVRGLPTLHFPDLRSLIVGITGDLTVNPAARLGDLRRTARAAADNRRALVCPNPPGS